MQGFGLIVAWTLRPVLGVSAAMGQSPPDLSFELHGIHFPEKRPFVGEAIDDLGTLLDDEQRRVLRGLSKALLARPHLGAKVVGFVDEREYSPPECFDLSLRRAKAMHDWLLGHGLPWQQLQGPVGESTLFSPPVESTTADNRRVEFEPYRIPGD